MPVTAHSQKSALLMVDLPLIAPRTGNEKFIFLKNSDQPMPFLLRIKTLFIGSQMRDAAKIRVQSILEGKGNNNESSMNELLKNINENTVEGSDSFTEADVHNVFDGVFKNLLKQNKVIPKHNSGDLDSLQDFTGIIEALFIDAGCINYLSQGVGSKAFGILNEYSNDSKKPCCWKIMRLY